MAVLTATIEYAVVATASIIAIMNPISTSAVYLTLTEDMSEDDRMRVIKDAMKIGLIVLFFFAISGQVIFSIFNLTIPAFKIAGGILLLSFAIGMLQSTKKKAEYSPEDLENISVVPLAFPLTCGAGTITTVILFASEASNIYETFLVYFAIIVSIGVSYFMMLYAPEIFRIIGKHEERVIVKLLSIFVLAIAVEFLIGGIGEALPQMLSGVDFCCKTP
jgi:multiple antibiotic resistance protein